MTKPNPEPEPENALDRLRRYERENRADCHVCATEDATQAAGLCGVAIKLIGLALDCSPPEGRARLLKDSRALLERAGDKLTAAADWKPPTPAEEDD